MTLYRRAVGSVEIAVLSGTLDAAAAQDVRRDLAALFEEGRRHLVLDVSGVRTVDSSGLSVIVTALKAARAAGGDVVLLGPTPAVRSVLDLTKLTRILEVFDDEAAAVARLTS